MTTTQAPIAEAAEMTTAAALNSALDVALGIDPKVLLLGEDIADPSGGVFKVTKGLSTRYGAHRVRDTPIAEQSILGAAIGAALAGYRPVAEVMFFDFVTVAMDQLVNHAAKFRYLSGGQHPVPVTVRTVVGNSRFGAQHSQSLEAWFMHTPGVKVVFPSTPADAKGLLLASVFDDDPCLFIEHVALHYSQKEAVPAGDHRVPLGEAAVRRPGDDVTVISYGAQMPGVLAAAETLAAEGISVEVIDLRTLVPLDFPTVLASVARTRRAVVVHGAVRFAGPGAEIGSTITEELFEDLAHPVVRLGAPYAPTPFLASGLETLPVADDVVAAVRRLAST